MGIIKDLKNGKRLMNESMAKSDILLELTEDDKRHIRDKLLLMFKDIKRVCEKHSITYFLVYGSAIGAVRHKGFIPWDDDLDIGMPRKDYRKFQSVFEEELGKKYILSAPNYSQNAKTRFPKILLKGSHFREIVDSQNPDLQCLFLDIFILDNLPDNSFEFKKKGYLCNFYEFIAGQVLLYENKDELVKQVYSSMGKLNYLIRMMIGFVFSFKSSSKWCDLVDKTIQYDDETTKRVGFPTGRKHYFGDFFERNEVLPVSYGTFEGIEVPLFHDADICLRKLYGDYMKIPPIEKRERHFIREFDLHD